MDGAGIVIIIIVLGVVRSLWNVRHGRTWYGKKKQ
jgi:hypothetical protein